MPRAPAQKGPKGAPRANFTLARNDLYKKVKFHPLCETARCRGHSNSTGMVLPHFAGMFVAVTATTALWTQAQWDADAAERGDRDQSGNTAPIFASRSNQGRPGPPVKNAMRDKLAAELREGASERLIDHKRRAVERYRVEEYDPSDVSCLWIEKRTSGANKRSTDDAQLPAAQPRSAPSLSRSSTEVE